MSNSKPKLLTSGVRGFDQLFDGGGIVVNPEEGTSILIEGGPGLGKTTLALQLASNAFLNHQAVCLFYTFEQSAAELESMIDAFKWGVSIERLSWSAATERAEEILRKPGEGSRSGAGEFWVIDAHDMGTIEMSSVLTHIENQVKALRAQSGDSTPLFVLDSLGGISKLVEFRRRDQVQLLRKARQLKAIVVLVRERDAGAQASPTEYITNVVIDLQHWGRSYVPGGSVASDAWAVAAPHVVMEIKKTRNQQSRRGPHECEICKADADTRRERGGCFVYPSLESVAADCLAGATELVREGERGACFDIPALDEALGLTQNGRTQRGIPHGQSLLIKGRPGCLKTELGVRFLLEGLKDSPTERGLFVTCRIDKSALGDLEIYAGRELQEFNNRVHVFDARDPYLTPEHTMANIVDTVEECEAAGTGIRRAVIFGIGMLDTLPASRRNSLPFLQVLIAYCRQKKISAIFIDWPHEEAQGRQAPFRPTELTEQFVAAAIQIEREQLNRGEEVRPVRGGELRLIRKVHRFVDRPVGMLRLRRGKLVIEHPEQRTHEGV